MTRFLLLRFVIALTTLLAVSILVFVMARIHGDPRAVLLGTFFTQEQWDAVGIELGLDKSWYQQYGIFMRDTFTGSFGESARKTRPVREVISERIIPTLQLGAAAFVFSLVIGVPLGVFSAVRRGGVLDFVAKVLALIGQAAPAFWIGIVLIFLFAVQFRWVPLPDGRTGPPLSCQRLRWAGSSWQQT